ncbi:MAG: hypothetical protein ACK4SY_02025 [Pyrobaculum sp.]
MWEIIKADLKAAARRPEETAYIATVAIAAGVLASAAGWPAVYLIALLASQLSAYLYVIRDWDRGVLEGLIYYTSHVEIYISKLVVTGLTTALATALATLFIHPAHIPTAVITALLFSTVSSLAALFAVYGGLPPPAATAMAIVLALPPAVAAAEGHTAAVGALVLTAAVGTLVAALLDYRH